MTDIIPSGKSGSDRFDDKATDPTKVLTRLDARILGDSLQNLAETTRGYNKSGNEGVGLNNVLSDITLSNTSSARDYKDDLTKSIQTLISARNLLAVNGSSTANAITLETRKITSGNSPDGTDYSKVAPLPFKWEEYLTFSFIPIATNTGATQIQITDFTNASTLLDVVKEDGSSLQGGEIIQGQITEIYTKTFSGTKKYVLRIKNIIQISTSPLTISGGAITITGSSHSIDTESSASTDDLDTISGGVSGQILYLKSTNDARNVVIKHNTGNIFNPAGLDITLDLTSDIVFLRYDSTLTKWIVVSKIISNDSSVVLLSRVFPSNVASVEFNSSLLTSAFSKYIIEIQNFLPATNGAGLQFQVSNDNGSSYVSSNYLGTVFCGGSTDGLVSYTASTARINLCGNFNADPNWGASNSAGKGISGNLTIFNPSSSSNKIIEFSVSYQSVLNYLQKSQGSSICNNSTTAINAIKIYFNTGNIASGSIKLYGVK